MGPGLTIPIFEGGQLRSTLQVRQAQQQEAAITYQKTVLQAWHDIDNALTAYKTEQARRDEIGAGGGGENKRAVSLGAKPLRPGGGGLPVGCWMPSAACCKRSSSLRRARRMCRPIWWHCTRRWAADGRRTCRRRARQRRNRMSRVPLRHGRIDSGHRRLAAPCSKSDPFEAAPVRYWGSGKNLFVFIVFPLLAANRHRLLLA